MKVRALLVCASMLLIAARKKVPATPPPPTVQVTEVQQQDVPIFREWVGTLDGFVNADIKPQVTGYIQKQAYQEGSLVRQGAVLFFIDPRNYQDLADQAKSTLDHNIATLAKVRLDVKRDKELIAAQAITRQQLDNDEAAEREAAANVESAWAVRQADARPHSRERRRLPASWGGDCGQSSGLPADGDDCDTRFLPESGKHSPPGSVRQGSRRDQNPKGRPSRAPTRDQRAPGYVPGGSRRGRWQGRYLRGSDRGASRHPLDHRQRSKRRR